MEIIIKYFSGVLFIILGFLVVKFPMLIAGYNTLPKQEREKIDISRMSRHMRSWLVGIGVAVIAGIYLIPKMGLQDQMSTYMLIVIVGGCLLMSISGNKKYAKGISVGKQSIGKQSKIALWVTGVVTGIVFISIVFTLLPAGVEVGDENLKITGAYPVSLSWSAIDHIEVRESIPPVHLRTNGASFGKWQKGYYKVEGWGRSRFYLQSKNAPFLIIYSSTEPIIVINRKNKESLYSLYKQIREKTGLD